MNPAMKCSITAMAVNISLFSEHVHIIMELGTILMTLPPVARRDGLLDTLDRDGAHIYDCHPSVEVGKYR